MRRLKIQLIFSCNNPCYNFVGVTVYFLIATILTISFSVTIIKLIKVLLKPVFFNNLVLVLENYFVHRSRTIEKKDGNPLNEVRVLGTSMMGNGGRLAADKSIRLDPATSILKLRVGDEIAVGEEDFGRLATAFFADLESKFL